MKSRTLPLLLALLLPACGGSDPNLDSDLRQWREKENFLKAELATLKEESRLQEIRINESKLREFAELEIKTKSALEEVRAARDILQQEVEKTRQELNESAP